MKKKYDRVHLVLAEGYIGPAYVDSAWTTGEGAAQRVKDLEASARAFRVSKDKLKLSTVEVRLDVMGVPIVVHIPQEPAPEAKP